MWLRKEKLLGEGGYLTFAWNHGRGSETSAEKDTCATHTLPWVLWTGGSRVVRTGGWIHQLGSNPRVSGRQVIFQGLELALFFRVRHPKSACQHCSGSQMAGAISLPGCPSGTGVQLQGPGTTPLGQNLRIPQGFQRTPRKSGGMWVGVEPWRTP